MDRRQNQKPQVLWISRWVSGHLIGSLRMGTQAWYDMQNESLPPTNRLEIPGRKKLNGTVLPVSRQKVLGSNVIHEQETC